MGGRGRLDHGDVPAACLLYLAAIEQIKVGTMKTSAIILATVFASASAFLPSQQNGRPNVMLEMAKENSEKGSKRKAALKVSGRGCYVENNRCVCFGLDLQLFFFDLSVTLDFGSRCRCPWNCGSGHDGCPSRSLCQEGCAGG